MSTRPRSSWLPLAPLWLWIASCGGGGGGQGVTVNPTIVPTLPPPTAQPTSSPGSSTGASVDIAMPIRPLAAIAGAPKGLGLPVTVAGRSSEALLDTGSGGLRLLASAVGTSGLQRTGIPETVVFGDGTRFVGEVATAPVQIGSVATEAAIPIQLITTIDCIPTQPDCPGAATFTAAGQSGIIGVSLFNFDLAREAARRNGLVSPLIALPSGLDSGYVIRTGGFSAAQGIFTVGLTAHNTTGFNIAPLQRSGSFADGTPSWNDEVLRPSYSITSPGLAPLLNNVAASTLFDTGASDISIRINSTTSDDFLLRSGASLSAVLSGLFTFQLTSGSTPSSNRVFVSTGTDSDPLQILGMPFFFQFDTVWDINQGRLGFRAR